jgi:ParB family chromosome partitioning protein
MTKRDLRLAVAEFGAAAPAFDAVTTFGHPGERQLPGALLVERQMLTPDPAQPRKVFDQEKLEDLAESIRQVGLLQPLRVRPGEDGKYIIVNGERRWRACMLADVPEIPVVVRDSPADDLAFEMLVENLQREDLSDEEEAEAYRTLIDQRYSVRQIAARLGVSIGRISKKVRVYEDDALAEPILRGEMTGSQAEELLVAPAALRAPLAQTVVEARKAGSVVPLTELRAAVREARDALDAGHAVEEVMESVSGRNTFRAQTAASAPANPHRTIDIAVKNLVGKIHGVIGTYPDAPMSGEVSAALDEALAALATWRQRNGVIA